MSTYHYKGVWTMKVGEHFAVLYSEYQGRRNFYIEARLVNGEIVYNNPRLVAIPPTIQKWITKTILHSGMIDMDVQRERDWYK